MRACGGVVLSVQCTSWLKTLPPNHDFQIHCQDVIFAKMEEIEHRIPLCWNWPGNYPKPLTCQGFGTGYKKETFTVSICPHPLQGVHKHTLHFSNCPHYHFQPTPHLSPLFLFLQYYVAPRYSQLEEVTLPAAASEGNSSGLHEVNWILLNHLSTSGFVGQKSWDFHKIRFAIQPIFWVCQETVFKKSDIVQVWHTLWMPRMFFLLNLVFSHLRDWDWAEQTRTLPY